MKNSKWTFFFYGILASSLIVFSIYFYSTRDKLGTSAVKELMGHTQSDDAFNGIKIEEFENFYRDWHLVTARYRIDRNQQRVTFANPIAWKALSTGSKTFPEGSMFVKTGFEVGEDPRFPSSKVPGAQLRVMIMKRDFQRYPLTDGWGYALLNRFGTRLANGEIKYNVEKYKSLQDFEKACHACHRLVADNDFVFSKPMFEVALGYHSNDIRSETLKAKFHNPSYNSELTNVRAVLNFISMNHLNENSIKYFEMSLFEGSLPELRAPLTNLAHDEQVPYLIFDPVSKIFTIALPQASTVNCKRQEKYITGCLNLEISAQKKMEINQERILCNGMTNP
jgi:hypothetical protein